MGKTVKKTTNSAEDEIKAIGIDFRTFIPESVEMEIIEREPEGEVLKPKEIIGKETITEHDTDKRGIRWTREKGEQEWTGKYQDEAGVRYVTKKDQQGNETWLSEDGKTTLYTKTKDGKETWYGKNGKKLRSKTPDGHEKLYTNGKLVADIQWDKDGKTGTGYIKGMAGETKLQKGYGGRGKDSYYVSNDNYSNGWDNLVIHKNGGLESLPNKGATQYRADGTLKQVEFNDGSGDLYNVEADGKTIKSSTDKRTGETTYYTGGGITNAHQDSDGKISYSINSGWHKTHSVNSEGTTTYYNESNKPTYSVDKKGNETHYAADGKTVVSTIDKKGKITFYTPDGKVDKDKTKLARQMVEDKAKQAAALKANEGQQKGIQTQQKDNDTKDKGVTMSLIVNRALQKRGR